MRPLGIPTFTDKLVQEVLRLVLQAVYEPVFLNCSHGFRPNRSCHTALAQAKQESPVQGGLYRATSRVALTTLTTLFWWGW